MHGSCAHLVGVDRARLVVIRALNNNVTIVYHSRMALAALSDRTAAPQSLYAVRTPRLTAHALEPRDA